MVLSGLGVGLLPYQAAIALGNALGLAVRPLPEDWAERTMLVCVKRDRPPNTSLTQLVEHLISNRVDSSSET
jgi:DNA-binding transcriptional LysR family regulator